MQPQSPIELITHSSMYVIGAGGSVWTWSNNERLFSVIIALLTVTLLVTHIILNVKRIRQFGKIKKKP